MQPWSAATLLVGSVTILQPLSWSFILIREKIDFESKGRVNTQSNYFFWYMGLILTKLTSPIFSICYTPRFIKWLQWWQRDFNFCGTTVISWAHFAAVVWGKQNTPLQKLVKLWSENYNLEGFFHLYLCHRRKALHKLLQWLRLGTQYNVFER